MSVRRIARDTLAVALIVIGIAIGWLPGPGGFLAIIGLALIAQEVPWIADVLDATEIGIRRFIRSCKRIFIFRSQ
ncbi:MAG: PGPGW domain-containing protein [Aureliella sp.]